MSAFAFKPGSLRMVFDSGAPLNASAVELIRITGPMNLDDGDGRWHHESLQVEIDSEDQRFGLFCDWEPEDVHRVEEALATTRPGYCGSTSGGRADGTDEIRAFAALSLRDGGVAVDDSSDHCWTLQEIHSDLKVDGLGFFDFLGHYAKYYATQIRTGPVTAFAPVHRDGDPNVRNL